MRTCIYVIYIYIYIYVCVQADASAETLSQSIYVLTHSPHICCNGISSASLGRVLVV